MSPALKCVLPLSGAIADYAVFMVLGPEGALREMNDMVDICLLFPVL